MLVRLLLQFVGRSILPHEVPAGLGAVALDLGSFLRTKSKEPRRLMDNCSRERLFELRAGRVWSSSRQCKLHNYIQLQSRLGLQTIQKIGSRVKRFTRIYADNRKDADWRGLLFGVVLFRGWLVVFKRLDPGSNHPTGSLPIRRGPR